MKEIWKDIKEYEGLYQISNLGNVRSIKNKIHLLKTIDDGKGYEKVRLCKKGIIKSFRVHRLVAQAFIDNPNNYSEINHKDNNRSNNSVNNLEWCDREYNIQYSVKQNRMNCKSVVAIKNSKVFVYNSIKEASEKTGVYRSNIGECCNGIRQTAGGYKWAFLKGEI